MSLKSVIPSFGVVLMTRFTISGQSGMVAVNARTSSYLECQARTLWVNNQENIS